MDTNYFKTLSSINVSDHIEKKGEFSYLSWPFAVSQLRQFDSAATWEVRRFNGLPYLGTELGYFVEVAVTVQGITLSQIHPILDGRNRPILSPSSFDINTSIQRCLVKAIALHGLGLYIYAGEDVPEGDSLTTEQGGKAIQPTARPTATATVSRLPVANPASAAQLRYVVKLIDETGTPIGKLMEYFNIASLDELTTQTASRAIKSLEKNRRAA